MSSRIWMVVSLVLTCLIAALALSQVYSTTQPRIEQAKAEALKASLVEVLPSAVEFTELEPGSAWSGRDAAGTLVGIVFRVAPRGYGGPVPTVVGLDTIGRITAIGVSADMKETPGLGLKARDNSFRDQFRGLDAADVKLERDGGTIDAISAATITSRAVADGVREGIERYAHLLEQ